MAVKKRKTKRKDNRGGARRGSGRKRGSVQIAKNVDKIALAAYARKHAEAMIDELVELATTAESEAARVSAINAVLDRGFGKPPQDIDIGNPEGEEFAVGSSAQKIIDVLNDIAKQKAAK